MKKNICILTVILSLALSSTVFANSPANPNDMIEITPISANSSEMLEIMPINAEASIEDNYLFQVLVPEQYEQDVIVIALNSYPPIYNVMVKGEVESDSIIQVRYERTDDGYEYKLTVNEGEFVNEKSSEIQQYFLENEEEIFVVKKVEEETENTTFINVYSGSGYMIQMPENLKDEVIVVSTRSNPPQLIFNYTDGESATPIFNLGIIQGEYNGENTVLKTGNGYTFTVEYNEVLAPTERFTEIKTYFEENLSDLIALAVDYNVGGSTLVINGKQVGEYINTGEGEYMVPLRLVAESVGQEVYWNSETSSIEITNGVLTSNITIGEKTYYVNKAIKTFRDEPVIIDGTTYVPVSFITDGLGLEYKLGNGALIVS